MMETQTKVASKTYAMVAVTVLAAAGAAYAAMGLLGGQRGYQNLYVQCHDGSTLEHTANVTRMQLAGSRETVSPGAPCVTAADLSVQAEDFCMGRMNPNTGKTGISTYSVSQKCIVQVMPNYGYGYNDYGYGYNTNDVTTSQQAKVNTTLNKKTTEKKSIFNFWKK